MFKKTVICLLVKNQERVIQMSEQIDSLVTDFNKAFADMAAALDNIAADEASLATQIDALVKQVGDLIAAGGTLSAADFEALSVVRNAAVAMAEKTKGIADAVPDPVPPPAG